MCTDEPLSAHEEGGELPQVSNYQRVHSSSSLFLPRAMRVACCSFTFLDISVVPRPSLLCLHHLRVLLMEKYSREEVGHRWGWMYSVKSQSLYACKPWRMLCAGPVCLENIQGWSICCLESAVNGHSVCDVSGAWMFQYHYLRRSPHFPFNMLILLHGSTRIKYMKRA